ncbi:Uncharacterized protein TCM_024015 [Theobroma cacao]|uniref:Uncharacterized protein n=1 Tax=Theobroma cacao TaxID=3641 RepID=A0A061EVY4_THECC|nr:Uncharacterized protein TCM_024015 [Theobroma cacao]
MTSRHSGQWVDGIYKGGESRKWGIMSDLSFASLMKLVEDVVGVNSKIHEIELHALIITARKLSRPIIKDDEDVALILLEQMNVSAVYVTIKECQTNVRSYEKVVQHGQHCDIEGDTSTLEDNTASNEGNENLFPTCEDRFDNNSDNGLDEWHDDSLNDDWLYDSDILICNNVKGKMELVGGGDGKCKEFLYAANSRCKKVKLKRALNMLALEKQFEISVKRSCKGRFEVGCKDKAFKFGVRAIELLEGEY